MVFYLLFFFFEFVINIIEIIFEIMLLNIYRGLDDRRSFISEKKCRFREVFIYLLK